MGDLRHRIETDADELGRRGVQLLCTHLNVFGSMGGYYYDENYTPTMAGTPVAPMESTTKDQA